MSHIDSYGAMCHDDFDVVNWRATLYAGLGIARFVPRFSRNAHNHSIVVIL
jgi:hypothetical protein